MMCAFMTPVLKNDWEVYNSQKMSRASSESNSKRCTPSNSRSQSMHGRRRGIGETRSLSYNINTRHDSELFARKPQRSYHLSTQNSRATSRASFSTVSSCLATPTKGERKSNGHHHQRSHSFTKFHNKVMDKLKNVLHLKEQQDAELNNKDETAEDEKEVKKLQS